MLIQYKPLIVLLVGYKYLTIGRMPSWVTEVSIMSLRPDPRVLKKRDDASCSMLRTDNHPPSCPSPRVQRVVFTSQLSLTMLTLQSSGSQSALPIATFVFSAIYPTATLDRLWTRRRLDDYTTGTDHYLKRWRGKCPKTPNNVWSEWA